MGDRTRIRIVEALARGPQSVGNLSQHSGMALPSFLQHLKILEAVEVVRTEKVGRVRICRLRPEALLTAQAWIEAQRTAWSARLDNLDRFITEQQPFRGDTE